MGHNVELGFQQLNGSRENDNSGPKATSLAESSACAAISDAADDVCAFPSDCEDCNEGEGVCSICLEEFAPGERISLLLECEHIFHKECLAKWWNCSKECPNCREPMVWPCVGMVF